MRWSRGALRLFCQYADSGPEGRGGAPSQETVRDSRKTRTALESPPPPVCFFHLSCIETVIFFFIYFVSFVKSSTPPDCPLPPPPPPRHLRLCRLNRLKIAAQDGLMACKQGDVDSGRRVQPSGHNHSARLRRRRIPESIKSRRSRFSLGDCGRMQQFDV